MIDKVLVNLGSDEDAYRFALRLQAIAMLEAAKTEQAHRSPQLDAHQLLQDLVDSTTWFQPTGTPSGELDAILAQQLDELLSAQPVNQAGPTIA